MSRRCLIGVALLATSFQAANAQDSMAESETMRMGASRHLFTLVDRFEGRWSDGSDAALLWDAQGWYGGDINKLWWKSEGDAEDGDVGEAELQLLFSRAITPFFDLQAGVRQDFEPDSLTYGVFGVQGLAPYWFELDAAAFVSEEGDVTSRLEAEYDLLLTQRLVLQPRAEAEIAFQDVEERGLGTGVTGVDLGLRLRYEIRRELAPYVGVEWTRLLGDTADLARLAGESDEETVFIFGLRAWF